MDITNPLFSLGFKLTIYTGSLVISQPCLCHVHGCVKAAHWVTCLMMLAVHLVWCFVCAACLSSMTTAIQYPLIFKMASLRKNDLCPQHFHFVSDNSSAHSDKNEQIFSSLLSTTKPEPTSGKQWDGHTQETKSSFYGFDNVWQCQHAYRLMGLLGCSNKLSSLFCVVGPIQQKTP